MLVQFRNPFPLLIRFKTLINNPNSFIQSHRVFPDLRFFSSSSSSSSSSSAPVNCSSSSNTEIVATPPMSTPSLLPSSSSVAAIDNTIGIAAKCWSNYESVYKLPLYTPFVVALAAGNLHRDSFRHYIAQDIFFLRAFVTAFTMAEDFADDDDAKDAIAKLKDSVNNEMKMHDSFVKWCKQEWGIDLAEEPNPNPATVKYTEFLVQTASGKIEGLKNLGALGAMTPFEKTKVAAYALGAMTPCMRLYSYVAKEILALLGNSRSSHVYKKWIENYSSEAFEESASQTEQLLDKLSVTLTGEELDLTEKLYYQAMKLELDFFLAQPLVQKIVVPLSTELKETGVHLMLFSDFDLTCSKIDSSSILATVGIKTAPKSDKSQSDQDQSEEQIERIARIPSADLQKTWDMLSKQYTEEFEQCVENTLLIPKADKFDYETLHKALMGVSEFEKDANVKVIDSGVLKGMNIEDIKKAGEHLQFEDGCTNFFQSILRTEKLSLDIHILSFSWCADLIRSSFSPGGLDALNIHANEFTYENSLTTGEIVKKVETPIDKVETFNKILQDSGKDGKYLTVYIGDSLGDLLCLVKADIGIVIGTSDSLRRVGEHFGISFVPLYAGLVKKQKDSSPWKGHSGTLYTVSTWAEIHSFFLGNNPLA